MCHTEQKRMLAGALIGGGLRLRRVSCGGRSLLCSRDLNVELLVAGKGKSELHPPLNILVSVVDISMLFMTKLLVTRDNDLIEGRGGHVLTSRRMELDRCDMKRKLLIWSVALLGLGAAVTSQGAMFSGTYTFSTANTDVPAANSGITFGAFTVNGGLTENAWDQAAQRFGATGWAPSGTADYVSFVLTPTPASGGYTLNNLSFEVYNNFNMGLKGNDGWWQIWSGTTELASGSYTLPAVNGNATITPAVSVNFSDPLTIRLAGYGHDNGKDGILQFDNVLVGGVNMVPEPVNVALGIFAGVFAVGGLVRNQRVRRLWSRGT